MQNDNLESFPLFDSIDHEVLMHRDAHFGGKFSIMIDYYKKDGKGVYPDFDLARLERLNEIESQMNHNLAALILSGSEAEKIGQAKDAYQNLSAIYEVKNPKNRNPKLIADLILSEEEETEEAINAVVEAKAEIVPYLIELLRKEEFADPLFPGYGQAAGLATKCLGRIGDKRAIISLFESLGGDDFFAEDQAVKALHAIGEPAKTFLLTVVRQYPLNEDNQKAAIALIEFKDDPEVALKCFELLKDPVVQKDFSLPSYLALACSGLKETLDREEFSRLADREDLSKVLREDIRGVVTEWSKERPVEA